MEEQPPNYRREFARSPYHAYLAVATLGLGFLSAHLLGLIVGVTAFALGWIYLPDLPFFRRRVDRQHEEVQRAAALAQVADFVRRRDDLLNSLSTRRRERYQTLASVCRDIENASADNPLATGNPATDPRLRKLDELMWTYLRLLTIEESLEKFLETERREELPRLVQEAELETSRLSAEVEPLKVKGGALYDSRKRLLDSRLERLGVLRKRLERIEQAKDNLALVVSEQERLDQQIKLIRADAVATRNAETLTARIDATVEHLGETNKWLSELDEFKDLVGDMPATDLRVGFDSRTPPPVIQPSEPAQANYQVVDRRTRQANKEKQR
jgi:hypothetical protein